MSQNSNSLNAVISSLTNSGISEDDIQTSNFRIYPLYDFSDSKDKQILIGYRVSNMLSIKTDKIDSAGNVIDIAVSIVTTKNSGEGLLEGLSMISDQFL